MTVDTYIGDVEGVSLVSLALREESIMRSKVHTLFKSILGHSSVREVSDECKFNKWNLSCMLSVIY